MLFPMEENENFDTMNDETFGSDSFGLYSLSFLLFRTKGCILLNFVLIVQFVHLLQNFCTLLNYCNIFVHFINLIIVQ